MPTSPTGHPATELFRFARLRPTPIIDVEHRAARRAIPADAAKRRQWARATLAGTPVSSLGDLEFPYLEYLKPHAPLDEALLARDDLRDPAALARTDVAADPRYLRDHARLEELLLASAIEGRPTEAVAKLLQLVERFPSLHEQPARAPFAPVVTKRVARVAKVRYAGDTRDGGKGDGDAADPLTLAEAVRVVWQARNAQLRRLREEHLAARRSRSAMLRSPAVVTSPSPAQVPLPAGHGTDGGRTPGSAGSSGEARRRSARREATSMALTPESPAAPRGRLVTGEVVASLRRLEEARANSSPSHLLESSAGWLTTGLAGATSSAVTKALGRLKEFAGAEELPLTRFCETYAALVNKADAAGLMQANTPALPLDDRDFAAPSVTFTDEVRVLGKAELVRVDEEFVSYSPGEISYIQTVLAGETRTREVRAENTTETSVERVEEEQSETSRETSASTKAELKSQIETELRSRLESNVNASANASGGGTIGVVDVSGGASVGATVGVGLDTRLQTRNESSFAQEIVQKGLERTTRRTLERRLTRTVQTYWSHDTHVIDNRDGDMVNGTYVFLNKHVMIRETTYGARAFLQANLLAPGRSLLLARSYRLRAAEEAAGTRPTFSITPADITPANYMQLAGEFRAQNVEPPPPPIDTLSRVYKTDTANAASEAEPAGSSKIAEILVPLYGKYKRFLVTENVELPEGYEVADVQVAVAHGANGMSLPAHLPFTLPGAAMYAAASFTPFIMGILGPALLPAWAWSVAYAASPLLHYNTDSSHATITVGTESDESRYYFFEADDLLAEVSELLQAITLASPGFIERVKGLAEGMLAQVQLAAADVPPEMAGRITSALTSGIGNVTAVLKALSDRNFPEAARLMAKLPSPPGVNLSNLDALPKVFAPVTKFLEDIAKEVTSGVGTAISEALGVLLADTGNMQVLSYAQAAGTRKRLPVAINVLALKPGVTVNLVACLRRTDEALARWQLRTFDAFHQAHLQLVAEYENRLYTREPLDGRAPAILRREEHTAIKERVLYALNAKRDETPQDYDLERLQLFEHALDWENMSYRVFNYGPSTAEMALERTGVLAGTDDRRRQFLTATWAQVMIPLQPHERLAAQVLDYFHEGGGSVEAAAGTGLEGNDELTALYRDLVLSRSLGEAGESTTSPAVVPTDLVALYRPGLADELPRNPAYPA